MVLGDQFSVERDNGKGPLPPFTPEVSQRLAGFFLDLAFVTPVSGLFSIVSMRQVALSRYLQDDLLLGASLFQVILIHMMVFAVYMVGMFLWRGQTVGQMVFSLRLQGLSEQRGEAFFQALQYALLFVISIFGLGSLALTILSSVDRRSVFERLSGTRVVSLRPTVDSIKKWSGLVGILQLIGWFFVFGFLSIQFFGANLASSKIAADCNLESIEDLSSSEALDHSIALFISGATTEKCLKGQTYFHLFSGEQKNLFLLALADRIVLPDATLPSLNQFVAAHLPDSKDLVSAKTLLLKAALQSGKFLKAQQLVQDTDLQELKGLESFLAGIEIQLFMRKKGLKATLESLALLKPWADHSFLNSIAKTVCQDAIAKSCENLAATPCSELVQQPPQDSLDWKIKYYQTRCSGEQFQDLVESEAHPEAFRFAKALTDYKKLKSLDLLLAIAKDESEFKLPAIQILLEGQKLTNEQVQIISLAWSQTENRNSYLWLILGDKLRGYSPQYADPLLMPVKKSLLALQLDKAQRLPASEELE